VHLPFYQGLPGMPLFPVEVDTVPKQKDPLMMKNDAILHIDLSAHSVEACLISEALTDRFLGGPRLAASLCYRLIPKGCDPLGPRNILSICTGLLTGTPAPASARTHFCALSPFTGILGSSNAGGFFGPDLQSCGIQGLVITGRSPQPAYLFIDRGGVRIPAADRLWGTDTRQCEQRIRQMCPGRSVRVLSIGPAGENRSAMACAMIDTHSAAGRTGIGAVMGSKNLKAIVVNGKGCKHPMNGEMRKVVDEYVGPLIRSEMFLNEPLDTGFPGNNRPALDAMLAKYYHLMGWDDKGIPWPEQLHAMGLGDFHEKPRSIRAPCRFNLR
jgi:aldehyde:ferredoxin oxidoreductase